MDFDLTNQTTIKPLFMCLLFKMRILISVSLIRILINKQFGDLGRDTKAVYKYLIK